LIFIVLLISLLAKFPTFWTGLFAKIDILLLVFNEGRHKIKFFSCSCSKQNLYWEMQWKNFNILRELNTLKTKTTLMVLKMFFFWNQK
jgi:hypothetical protein